MAKNKENTDKLLVLKLREGNEQAFRKLFDLYRQDVYAYSLSILKSPPHAEEIVQEVFLRVWLKREGLNPELSLKSYIFTITRNLTLNLLTKMANNKKLLEAIFYKSQAGETMDREFSEQDYAWLESRAMEKLPPRCRLVFQMSRNQGKSYEEIAREMGISVNTVKYQMSKAMGIIRKFLEVNSDIVFMIAIITLMDLFS
ncbi:RNA polymerase sigma factor [Sinomicrobium soli]|uniref:RNA polymerase sigma factor n=1 Tax=Sinomicrobium sp. N-1-3-6 TaxID=2219864 RepID=UPI000DCE1092|nr:RNA polymerase sigma-70 factor [Sinomicrobium sp. N-1-3-6]RAV28425.1 RNA polymerase sigma-70 factor [Sinomicrobium sp. N-1-3-6]